MENPLISIVIPVYNAENYIEETINMFLNQTYFNLEIVVQDDRSKDKTWDILLEKFGANLRVKLAQNETNQGIGPNWNKAYDRATGQYVVIANADDIHHSTFIEKALKNIVAHDVDFVSFKYQILNERSNEPIHFTNENKDLSSGMIEDPLEMIFFLHPFHIIFTMFKKDNIDRMKIDGKAFLDTQICDFEFLLRYARDNRLLYYDQEPMGLYRIHATNNSSRPLAEFRSYYNGFIPLWHKYLLQNFGYKYKKVHYKKFVRYLKSVFARREAFYWYPFKQFIRYYLL